MAEVIGLAASIVQLVGVVESFSRFVLLMRDAPIEMALLSNEVNDLRLVLSQVEHSQRMSEKSQQSAHQSSSLMISLQDRCKELEEFRDEVTRMQTSGLGLKRLRWLPYRRKARLLMDSVARVKQDLSLSMSTMTASTTGRVETLLNDFMLSWQRDQQQITKTYPSEKERMYQLPQRLLSSIASRSSLSKPLLPVTRNNPETSPMVGFDVSASVGRPGTVTTCRCRCHRTSYGRSPVVLQNLLGALFTKYTAQPAYAGSCTFRNCNHVRDQTVQLVYFFPVWLCLRVIIAYFSYSPSGPSFGITVRRVVPENSDLFELCTSNNLIRIHEYFTTQYSTPQDLHVRSGENMLHWAIKYGHLEMTKGLLEAGTDPYAEDNGRRAPVDVAWFEIIAGSRSQEFRENLMTLFGDRERFELRRPGRLHRIILGFSTQDLKEALETCSIADLNLRDEEGKTALAWATIAGDIDSVRLLLEAGADPNIKDHRLDTPLMFAVYSTNPSTIPLLLAHGARFTANDRRETPYHKAAFRQDNAAYFQPFLDDANARNEPLDLDFLSDTDAPAMSNAALADRGGAAEFFIRNGADMDIADETIQTTMLWDTIKYKSPKVMEVLLRMGADVEYTHPDGTTLLHYAAEWGEVEAVELLFVYAERLRGIDLHAHNGEGFTALDVADRRKFKAEGFDEAFGELVEYLRLLREEGGSLAESVQSFASALMVQRELEDGVLELKLGMVEGQGKKESRRGQLYASLAEW